MVSHVLAFVSSVISLFLHILSILLNPETGLSYTPLHDRLFMGINDLLMDVEWCAYLKLNRDEMEGLFGLCVTL